MGSFFDAFTGKAQARDIQRANAEATKQVNAGYDKAETAIGGARTAAQGYYQPYAEQGNKANALYSGALGLNGAAGYEAARSAYSANPFLKTRSRKTRTR
jgi:hypothetical protein